LRNFASASSFHEIYTTFQKNLTFIFLSLGDNSKKKQFDMTDPAVTNIESSDESDDDTGIFQDAESGILETPQQTPDRGEYNV
jgi:hypothetical protein